MDYFSSIQVSQVPAAKTCVQHSMSCGLRFTRSPLVWKYNSPVEPTHMMAALMLSLSWVPPHGTVTRHVRSGKRVSSSMSVPHCGTR